MIKYSLKCLFCHIFHSKYKEHNSHSCCYGLIGILASELICCLRFGSQTFSPLIRKEANTIQYSHLSGKLWATEKILSTIFSKICPRRSEICRIRTRDPCRGPPYHVSKYFRPHSKKNLFVIVFIVFRIRRTIVP